MTSSSHRWWILCGLFLSFALVLSGCKEEAQQAGAATQSLPTIKWKMANTWPTGMPILEETTLRFVERVKAMTDGKFEIRVDSSNKHKAPLGIFDMVRGGNYQIGHTASYYWKGKDSATPVLTTIPFGMEAVEQYAWFYFGDGMKLQQKLYAKHGLYSFPGGNTGVQMGGWFNKKINSIEDLKGLKMRIPGLAGDVLARVGASPVNIPGGELYTALERGTIDALEWVNPAIDLKMGFQQIAKYYYTGWHEPAAELQYLINKKAFDELPKMYQEILKEAMKAAALDTLAQGVYENAYALDKMRQDHPELEILSFPPEVLAALKTATQEVIDELAASNPEAKEIIDNQRAYAAKAKNWTEISLQQYLLNR